MRKIGSYLVSRCWMSGMGCGVAGVRVEEEMG